MAKKNKKNKKNKKKKWVLTVGDPGDVFRNEWNYEPPTFIGDSEEEVIIDLYEETKDFFSECNFHEGFKDLWGDEKDLQKVNTQEKFTKAFKDGTIHKMFENTDVHFSIERG